MTTLAIRIKTEMQRCGLTQEALAKKSGMAQASIYKLVSGKALESRKISKIAAALGVNTDWLATGQGEKHSGRERMAADAAPTLPPRQQAFLDLINALPTLEQDKLMRELEEKERYFKEVFEDMTERKKA